MHLNSASVLPAVKVLELEAGLTNSAKNFRRGSLTGARTPRGSLHPCKNHLRVLAPIFFQTLVPAISQCHRKPWPPQRTPRLCSPLSSTGPCPCGGPEPVPRTPASGPVCDTVLFFFFDLALAKSTCREAPLPYGAPHRGSYLSHRPPGGWTALGVYAIPMCSEQ